MPDRYSGHKSPRDLTGRRGNQLMAEKRAADAAKERERKAAAEIAGGADTDLDDILDRHPGATDVYLDESGTVVVSYV